MIYVKVQFGLGNQMFQYAFGKGLEHEIGEKVFFDCSSFNGDNQRNFELSIFPNIDLNILSEQQMKNFRKKHFLIFKINHLLHKLHLDKLRFFLFADFFHYEFNYSDFRSDFFKKRKRDSWYNGLFQNEKYFIKIKDQIKKYFEFSQPDDEYNKQLLEQIQATPNAVCIHVRRSDYLTCGFNVLNENYYHKAIEIIKQKVKNPVFYIFGQDCEDFIKKIIEENDSPIHFVGDYNSIHHTDFRDMQLMAACKHFIIANSSFSWWGAWLGNYKDKIVIGPDPYFAFYDHNNILCEDWIKLTY